MPLGAYSEVGRLRRVMVHRPGLEHTRLTPSNAEDLLFDDVIWVARAKAEHDMFVEAMRERGVEVFHAAQLLPPLPNFLFQRDCSCWIFGGVTINPMTKPARVPETMIMEVIYRFHPMYV